jgi:molecular chaperone DnaK
LSEAEVERMRQEAELYAEDDDQRRQLVTLRNQADSLFYSYESTLRDSGDFITEDLRRTAADRVTALRAALANRSITVEEMTQCLEALQQALYTIGEAVYQQAAGASASSGSPFGDSPAYSDPGYSDSPSAEPEFAYAAAAPWATDANAGSDDYGSNFADDETVTADYEAID